MRNMIFFILVVVGAIYFLIQHGASTQEKESNPQLSHKSDYKL